MKKYNLLLPIAGRAQRFVDAGYTMPKPLIMTGYKHMIDWSLQCINIEECHLIFIVRLEHVYNFGIDEILRQKYGSDIEVLTVDKITGGAAETCLYAKPVLDENLPLAIYTPDVWFDPHFSIDMVGDEAGFLLTFLANNPAHSYSLLDNDKKILKVAEKEVISEHANIGLYYFKSASLFIRYAEKMINEGIKSKSEYYVAPIYNMMITDGHLVRGLDVQTVHVLGTPEAHGFFCKRVLCKFGDKPLAISCDHSGYEFKALALRILENNGIKFIDVGTYMDRPCDYYDYVSQCADLMRSGSCDYSISFCRTGQGVNICANKFSGITSALVFDEYTAEYAIKHNCANHFAIPTKYVNAEIFNKMVGLWKRIGFEGGRHFTRISKYDVHITNT